MATVSEVLRNVFVYVFYPIIVTGVFLMIWSLLVFIISDGNDGYSKARRLTASVLPLVALVFFVTNSITPDSSTIILRYVKLGEIIHLLIGVVIGVLIIELFRYTKNSKDKEVGISVYALFLSSIGTFLIYAFMIDSLTKLNYTLFALLMSAGVDIIFRGFE